MTPSAASYLAPLSTGLGCGESPSPARKMLATSPRKRGEVNRPHSLIHTPAISPCIAREFCFHVLSARIQRAQGMPGAQCARSLACEMKKAHERSHRRYTPASPGIPYAMVLTVSFALSPVTGLVCHRRRRKLPFANLTPASGHQDHTTSPSADKSALVRSTISVHRIPPRVRDDREPPLCETGWQGMYC